MAFCLVQLGILAPNDDNIYLVTIAGQMLAGGHYYRDFLELNPPMYPVLMFPVQWLHGMSGIDLQQSFLIWISVVTVAAVVSIARLSSRLFDEGALAFMGIPLAIEVVLFFTGRVIFREQDHVALVLMPPALFWLAGRRPGEGTSAFGFALIVAATIGVLIRPSLLAAVGCAYAVRLAEERDWRLDRAAGLVCRGCRGPVWRGDPLWFPDWLRVAQIARTVYSTFDTSVWVDGRSIVAAAAIILLAAINELLGMNEGRRLPYPLPRYRARCIACSSTRAWITTFCDAVGYGR